MAIHALVAPSINKIQTDNFYFRIQFQPEDGDEVASGGFTLSNISISSSTHVDIDDLSLLYLQGNNAIISVDLPDNVTGKFTLSLTGNVSVEASDGTTSQEEIISGNKVIEYDTTSGTTVKFDPTATPEEPTVVTMQLSSASANNGGIIVVQIEFDYPVPSFTSSYVNVTPAGATKSAASNIDDDFKVWILLVTLPSSGSGMVQVSINENAIGFNHDALSAQVQHAPSINLNIRQGDMSIVSTFNSVINHAIRITGNNVNFVDVYGLLRPFWHHWDSNSGMLYIRGNGDAILTNFPFTVKARDSDGETEQPGTLTVQYAAPSIVEPTSPIDFYFGLEVDVDIEVMNNPTKVEVHGTWLGINHRLRDGKINIFGRIPERGTDAGQAIPGTNSGEFILNASNAGGDALEKKARWRVSSLITPQFGQGTFTKALMRGDAYTDTINVTGNPQPVITVEEGEIPTGLTIATSYSGTTLTISFTGTTTAGGVFTFKLRARNTEGTVISPEFTITVVSNFTAPSRLSPPPGFIVRQKNMGEFGFPYNAAQFFNLGMPAGTFSISGAGAANFEITSDGMLSLSTAGMSISGTTSVVVTCTNQEGSHSETFNFFIQS